MSVVLNIAAGAVTGALSACGIGGGTLLLLYLTLLAGYPQQTAQGINLLYFLPAAGLSLPQHWKNGMIRKDCALWGGVSGCLGAVAGAVLATGMETWLLRKLFGGYLLFAGVSILLRAKKKPSQRKEDRQDGVR